MDGAERQTVLNNGLGTNSLGSARVPTASVEIEGGTKRGKMTAAVIISREKKKERRKRGPQW